MLSTCASRSTQSRHERCTAIRVTPILTPQCHTSPAPAILARPQLAVRVHEQAHLAARLSKRWIVPRAGALRRRPCRTRTIQSVLSNSRGAVCLLLSCLVAIPRLSDQRGVPLMGPGPDPRYNVFECFSLVVGVVVPPGGWRDLWVYVPSHRALTSRRTYRCPSVSAQTNVIPIRVRSG
ncbi:hypothetical protein PYCCODRAFT_699268 [Trametes coccinea BRFM310]|uniref:Uncharacterized protein n=1 Tax=Trametes coccinea (strain BRFM310) TaxID=1353009 RepID=A0A1Y2IGM6_TRAC3|nr:hypothetical protein PYCCODRAFT_699268 [Trametes coccinea BRFM310]